MKHILLRTAVSGLVCVGLALVSFSVNAATGYMSFLNTPITVETGDAASYMRVGRNWSGAAADVSSLGIAQPTLQQKSKITTSRTSTHLVLQFEIPDNTTGVGGLSPLHVGDKVIVQINPNNSSGASLELFTPLDPTNPTPTERRNADYRYEVTIKNLHIVDFSLNENVPDLYLPDSVASWDISTPQLTSATAIWTDPMNPGAGGKYKFTLSIPLSEIGTPSSDIGISLAILNDLGHFHPPGVVAGSRIYEFTGTAFPMSMGITPTSEPGIIEVGGVANGNWVNPSSWGTGYFSPPTTAAVVFDQAPNSALSSAIRLGNCNASWNDIRPVPGLSGWEAWQQDPNNKWYLYNPPRALPLPTDSGPCRMAIWLNPKVMNGANPAPPSTLTKRRFLVVWGRPNIGGPNWSVAGLTAPVTVSGSDTHVSFIWNNPPAINFTGHPCMRVYVLPETLVAPHDETFIKDISTQNDLSQLEMDTNYFLGGLGNRVAQMNFSNIGPSVGCQESFCLPLISSNRSTDLQFASHGGWSLVGEALADNTQPAVLRVAAADIPGYEGKDRPSEKPSARVFVQATGFGVAAPQSKARYVYVEEIGAVAWAMPNSYIGTMIKDLRFEVSNPRVAAWSIVKGKTVEIPAPARTLFMAMEAAAVPGTPLPRFDTTRLDALLKEPLQPGSTIQAQIGVQAPSTPPPPCGCFDFSCRRGLQVSAIPLTGLIAIGALVYRRRKQD